MRKLLLLLMAVLTLWGCTVKETSSSLSLEEVVDLYQKQGVQLVQVDIDDEYAFSKTLNGINPTMFRVNEHQMLSIYVYSSSKDAASGLKEFEEKTATADLITYEKYIVNNLLIFYIPEGESSDPKISDVIKDMQAK